MLLEDDVGDVGAVVAVAVLEEELGEDELGRRGDPDVGAVDLDLIGLAEPVVGDRDAGGRDVVDDVEEMLVLPDLADPALVLDLDPIALRLEEAEDLGRVRRLAEDVEILGRPGDAGVAGRARRCPTAGRAARFGEQPQALDIEIDRLGRRLEDARRRGLAAGCSSRRGERRMRAKRSAAVPKLRFAMR